MKRADEMCSLQGNNPGVDVIQDLPVRLVLHLAGCKQTNQKETLCHGLYTKRS